MANGRLATLLAGVIWITPWATHATELVIATVNNGHMITLQKMSGEFERAHPDVKLKWITLEEGVLRQQVTRDVTTKAGQFDVMTIGAYEAPIWAKKGWIRPLTPSPGYEVADLLAPIRQSLSVSGQLYALPFYGESSMTMVRTDLLKAAGLKLGAAPTWAQIHHAAEKLHAPDKGVYGICLRGKPGWGENMSLITTMVNTFGGQWFNMSWQPQLQTPAWRNAVTLYADLLNQFGPPGAAANGYNENLALFMDGRCAIWVDATVAGGFVNRAESSKVAGKVAFLQAPVAATPKGAHWVWTWALAIPTSSSKAQAAQRFMEWATSRDYIRLVAEREGWDAVPSGTRQSTYASPQFRRANPHALVEQRAISTANPQDATLPRSPYTGIQWASIPEFQAIGTAVGQEISELLQDPVSVDEVLSKSQQIADRKMRAAGYYR
ncbi:MAG: sugar ABC transporter substrate-binding protein [Aquabacterium sp.]|uniref:ABC transporter substrate-binding protein n=1 Tax=Aquabacterium sp. TaxID=1872578 RepID=UPI0025C0E92C|nr:sugar ABC transporter substrate-binding protein [Aquabacterium sp.]MBI5925915.1 sugar ABC transporter substrate-binding protein [Aquabacterium sp.]